MASDNDCGYHREPLLDIETDQCIPDFLHMKKGIIGRMFNQVLLRVIVPLTHEEFENPQCNIGLSKGKLYKYVSDL